MDGMNMIYPKLNNPNKNSQDFSKTDKYNPGFNFGSNTDSSTKLINNLMNEKKKKKEGGAEKSGSKTNLYAVTQKGNTLQGPGQLGMMTGNTPYSNKAQLNDFIANTESGSSQFKKVNQKEVKPEAGLYSMDYNSQERTKDNSQSPNSGNEGKKDEIDFENCDVYLKKPAENNRKRTAFKFLEESFQGNVQPTSKQPITQDTRGANYKNNSPDNKNPNQNKGEKLVSNEFCSRRKKGTKTLENNNYEF